MNTLHPPSCSLSFAKAFSPKSPERSRGAALPTQPLGTRSWQPRGAGGAGGEGRGPVPLRGVAVTQRALFFAGEQDRHPQGETQGEGLPGRRGLQQTAPRQPSGRSRDLTKSSTMGEYGVRVADTQGDATGGSGDPVPEQSPLKLSSGTGQVPVALAWPHQPWELPGGGCLGTDGVFFPKCFSVSLCSCAVCGDRCHLHSWSDLSPRCMGWRDESSCPELGHQQGAETCHSSCHFCAAALGK